MPRSHSAAALLALCLAASSPAFGQSLLVVDPAGDDKGPGEDHVDFAVPGT